MSVELKPNAETRGHIYDSILDTIGNTPLVGLPHLQAELGPDAARILVKCEFFNPLASVKDRIGFAMIEGAERAGKITPGKSVLVEPTSGNTGIALAFVAAAKGYKLILTMPESMSIERRKMLSYLGAELILTPAEKGMKGAIDKAAEILAETEGAFSPSQFENPDNPQIHRETTAKEIWEDTKGKVDIVIAGVGTGGTISGIAKVLKEKNPELKAFAVEPVESPVISGGNPGPHKIQGIGAGFIPENLETGLLDGVIKIDSETAFKTAQKSARQDGLPGGISTGANIAAAIEIAKLPENKGKVIVTIGCSFAERYISTLLFEGLEG
ncbi:MAG: cysteine synthase A [Alphaproteobacteria bacterium]|nr:cysteine synthase A [Alphaproteobacteria bacterium]